MKRLPTHALCLLLLSTFLLSACNDNNPNQGLLDIISDDLGYLPVIATFEIVDPPSTTVEQGSEATFDLRYWSEGEIDRVQFWETVEDGSADLVYDEGYEPAYSATTRTDSLLFSYSVPDDLPDGAEITIEARVINHGLEDHPASSTVTLSAVEPE